MTVFLAIWTALTTRAGLAAAIVACMLLYYEGLPLGPARMIPFVGLAVSSMVDGRVDRARASGVRDERAQWVEAMRLLRQSIDADKRAAQAEIDKATQRYLEEKAAREEAAAANDELEAALAASEAENAQRPDGACRAPAISRGVSRALNKTGR